MKMSLLLLKRFVINEMVQYVRTLNMERDTYIVNELRNVVIL